MRVVYLVEKDVKAGSVRSCIRKRNKVRTTILVLINDSARVGRSENGAILRNVGCDQDSIPQLVREFDRNTTRSDDMRDGVQLLKSIRPCVIY